MTLWIALQCPTCGAHLQVAGTDNQFRCDHCGTAYLLRQPAQALSAAERDHLRPLTTYTPHLRRWLRVGLYEICVQTILDEPGKAEQMWSVDVEYRNAGADTLSCRRNQWILFDDTGYSYDPVSDASLLTRQGRPALTGERFLTPGMRLRGWLAFKLPPDLRVQRLQFLTGFLNTHTVEFLFETPTSHQDVKRET